MRYQNTDYFCGPAALQNALLVLRNTKVSQARIAELAGTSEAEGTDEEGVKRAAIALGYGVDELEFDKPLAAWGMVGHSLIAGGRPVVLCVDRWTHWVTAIGVCGSVVMVAEPGRWPWSTRENGLLVLHRDRFLKRWRTARRTRGKAGPVYYGIAIGPSGY